MFICSEGFCFANWGGRSYIFAFIFIIVCVFNITSVYRAVFLLTIYLKSLIMANTTKKGYLV